MKKKITILIPQDQTLTSLAVLKVAVIAFLRDLIASLEKELKASTFQPSVEARRASIRI